MVSLKIVALTLCYFVLASSKSINFESKILLRYFFSLKLWERHLISKLQEILISWSMKSPTKFLHVFFVFLLYRSLRIIEVIQNIRHCKCFRILCHSDVIATLKRHPNWHLSSKKYSSLSITGTACNWNSPELEQFSDPFS